MLTLRKHAIKEDEPYAPPSLYLISCGFLRHLKDKKVYNKKILCRLPKNIRRKIDCAATHLIRNKGKMFIERSKEIYVLLKTV